MSTPHTNHLRLQIASIVTGALALLAIGLSKFISNRLILVVVAVAVAGFVLSLVILARIAPQTPGQAVRRMLLGLLGAVVAGYLALFATISLGQDWIADHTNAFFQPRPLTDVAAASLLASDMETLKIETPDGATLRGWLVHTPGAQLTGRAPLVIYFGGSGSESSDVVQHARWLAPWAVALVNYRGFGRSRGTPTPGNCLADAKAIYDTLVARADVDSSRVAVVGYSLGTGIAVHAADQRAVTGVVLFAPYDSLKLVNPGASPLYEPLQPIMKTYFASIDSAPRIKSPLLIIVGSQDSVFPADLSRKLAAAWGGPSEVKVFEGEGHMLSEHNDAAWQEVAVFLSRLPAVSR